jgi:hypothetical protein
VLFVNKDNGCFLTTIMWTLFLNEKTIQRALVLAAPVDAALKQVDDLVKYCQEPANAGQIIPPARITALRAICGFEGNGQEDIAEATTRLLNLVIGHPLNRPVMTRHSISRKLDMSSGLTPMPDSGVVNGISSRMENFVGDLSIALFPGAEVSEMLRNEFYGEGNHGDIPKYSVVGRDPDDMQPFPVKSTKRTFNKPPKILIIQLLRFHQFIIQIQPETKITVDARTNVQYIKAIGYERIHPELNKGQPVELIVKDGCLYNPVTQKPVVRRGDSPIRVGDRLLVVEKNDERVRVNEQLFLNERYFDDGQTTARYTLTASMNHSGTYLGGHYTALVKRGEGAYYFCNDVGSRVERLQHGLDEYLDLAGRHGVNLVYSLNE